MEWINEYGDKVTEQDRADFIEDEICNYHNASGVIDRAYAQRVFDRKHTEVANG